MGTRWRMGCGDSRCPGLEVEGVATLGVLGSRESSRVRLGAPHVPDQRGEFQAPTCFRKPAPAFLEPVHLWVRGNGVPAKEAGF